MSGKWFSRTLEANKHQAIQLADLHSKLPSNKAKINHTSFLFFSPKLIINSCVFFVIRILQSLYFRIIIVFCWKHSSKPVCQMLKVFPQGIRGEHAHIFNLEPASLISYARFRYDLQQFWQHAQPNIPLCPIMTFLPTMPVDSFIWFGSTMLKSLKCLSGPVMVGQEQTELPGQPQKLLKNTPKP